MIVQYHAACHLYNNYSKKTVLYLEENLKVEIAVNRSALYKALTYQVNN